MNFKTFADLNSTIFSHIHELPKDIDLVAGIPRSGLLAANIIALYLNLPLTDINSLAEGRMLPASTTHRQRDGWIASPSEARKILVVDDSIYSGSSLNSARDKLKGTEFSGRSVFMAVYALKESRELADVFFEVVDGPRMFEWNYLHHMGLGTACFDIDGVLCPDPTEEQNDDGEKYISFIRNAAARFVPTYEIGCLVTTRLEKYRADTEYWLKKNNIRYKNLIMMDFATKEERIRSGSHGRFKAEHYRRIKDADIFIESNAGQAEEIAELSGKLVFCTDTHKVYPESRMHKTKRKIRHCLGMMLPPGVKATIKKLLHI